jgi:phospholipid/cholesterol/gamma-HCH transport system substrate-binding protein
MATAGSRNVKVGAFVLGGLLLLGMVIFLLGQERSLFAPRVAFKTTFADVSGLKAGAPVRLGGIDIGQVAAVHYNASDANDATIYVDFWVSSASATRVRVDTKAKVATKGLLGDKMLELTLGTSPDVAPPDSTVEGLAGEDYVGEAREIAKGAKATLASVESVSKQFADERLHRDLQGTLASLRTILDQVATGDGYPRRFLSDPQEAERISRTIERFERTADEAQATLAEVRGLVAAVKTGPGFAHDVIYGEGPKGLAEAAGLATELTTTLKGVRESKSLLHDAMYGGSGGDDDVFATAAAIALDVRQIVAGVKEGKGTIGGLLVDPSIYEDVKIVLGNVQRNDVLRALVRHSIQRDTTRPKVEVETRR